MSSSAEKETSNYVMDFDQILLHALGIVGDSVVIIDANLKLLFANVAAQNLLGFTLEDRSPLHLLDQIKVVGSKCKTVRNIAIENFYQPHQLKQLCNTSLLMTADARPVPFDMQASVYRTAQGRTYFILLIKDLSHTTLLQEAISFHQSHDPLTGLVNRSEFERSLQNALRAMNEYGQQAAVLYIDIDQFKVINDTCGHVAGDELLRQVTEILSREVAGLKDTLALIGGDEFGVLLWHAQEERALEKAEYIRALLEQLLFSWAGRTFSLSVSIGIALITTKSESWASILSQADAACFYAKSVGRNRIRLYSEHDRELAKSHLEMEWVSRIVKALRTDRLQLFAQKVVPIDGEGTYHLEILTRLIDEEGNIILPHDFLPAAERFNLIIMIDRWVVTHTFDWIKRQLSGTSNFGMCTINLSGCSLSQSSFLDFVWSRLQSEGIPGEKVCFEITETSAIQHLKQAKNFIGQLKAIGCKFALDDFGTGMSSFYYLKNLPVDYLKIDGIFVKDIHKNNIDYAMVKSINEIGHAMEMQTIAEFVEDDIILDKLRMIGVDYAQGYGIEKPLPLS